MRLTPRSVRLLAPVLVVMAVLALLPAAVTRAQSDNRCFSETGFCISGPLRQYWERNGGLAVFGFPVTPLQTETVEGWTGPVQWFERDRLEDHANEGKGVLAGRLGVERLAQQGRPWQFRPLGQAPQPGCRGFAETGYYMCGGFLTFWERNGGLGRFGFPITDQIVERLNGRDYVVQYFERRRMEFHPENLPPFDVLLGLLGNEIRANAVPVVQPTPTPQPASQQITLSEPGDNAQIGSPVRVSGTTIRVPAPGFLRYRFYEPNGRELARGNIAVSGQQGQPGAFNASLAFNTPGGDRVILELAEIDLTTGGIVARAERSFRFAAAAAQQIIIENPVSGSRIGTVLSLSGRTSAYPSEGDLHLAVLDSTGNVFIRVIFPVDGQAGRPATFNTRFEVPDQRGRLITVQVSDTTAGGAVIALSEVNVFAGTPVP